MLDQPAGQGIDHVQTKPELLGVVHHRQDGEQPDAIGDEALRVLGAHDALAKAGHQP